MSGIPALRGELVAPQEGTSDSLSATVKQVLDHRPSAVCMFVVDPESARASIDLILAEQVLLVTMGERCADPRVAEHIAVDLPDAAERLGANLQRIAAAGRSYLLVHESGRNEVATNCYLRFTAAAQRQYGMVLLQERAASRGERPPWELMEDMLARFPHAGLVVTLNPDIWLTARAGWNRELRQRNSGFRFATLGAAPVLWRRLGTSTAPGEAAALVGPLDGELGFAAVEAVVQMLLSPKGALTNRMIECELVTPKTLLDFARRYSAAANGLDVSAYLPAGPTSIAPGGE